MSIKQVMSQKRLYVLTDKSLDPIYASVQGGHAVAQWLLDHPNQDWNNSYLIYLKANIEYWICKLGILGEDYSSFKEPDLNNKVTSIAILSRDDNMFKKLKLLGE